MATHSSILGKSRGWRSLVGFSPGGCKESDMTEQLQPPPGCYQEFKADHLFSDPRPQRLMGRWEVLG